MRTSDCRGAARPQTRILFWGVGLILLTIATRAPLLRLDRPIDDEVVYAVAGQTIVGGGVPYVDVVERKPPLLFYVYAAVLRVFGTNNWHALHSVEILWILATMFGLYLAARRLFGPAAGLVAALLYSVFQAWSYWNNLAFNGEVLMNLPIVWAYVLAFRSADRGRPADLFAAGALVATAFLLKQPAAIAIVPLAMYVAQPAFGPAGTRPADRVSGVAALSSGFLLVLVGAAGWLYRDGLLADAFYWTITDHAIPRVFWVNGFANTLAFAVFCLPLTAGAWVSWHDPRLWEEHSAERNALAALAAVSLVGAYSSGRFYPHYFIAVIPALALLAAPWLAHTWNAGGQAWWLARVSQAWLIATIVVFAAVHARGLARQPAMSEAGAFLRAHGSADDRIFVWGQATRIYVDARRRPASRYIATFPLTGFIFGSPPPAPGEPAVDTRARILPGSWDHLRDDFLAHPPAFIVDTEAAPDARYPVGQFPSLAGLLSKDYQPVARTREGVIYQRDSSKPLLIARRHPWEDS